MNQQPFIRKWGLRDSNAIGIDSIPAASESNLQPSCRMFFETKDRVRVYAYAVKRGARSNEL